jgi:hypothetical protein
MSTQAAPPIPNSYTELRRGIKTATALYEASYSDAYVHDALIKKGFTAQQAEWIMLSAEVENVEHRKKVSRNIAIVMGIGWGIIVAIFLMTPDTETSHKTIQKFSTMIDKKFVGIALVVFLGSVGNFVRSYFQVKKAKQKLEALPVHVSLSRTNN